MRTLCRLATVYLAGLALALAFAGGLAVALAQTPVPRDGPPAQREARDPAAKDAPGRPEVAKDAPAAAAPPKDAPKDAPAAPAAPPVQAAGKPVATFLITVGPGVRAADLNLVAARMQPGKKYELVLREVP